VHDAHGWQLRSQAVRVCGLVPLQDLLLVKAGVTDLAAERKCILVDVLDVPLQLLGVVEGAGAARHWAGMLLWPLMLVLLPPPLARLLLLVLVFLLLVVVLLALFVLLTLLMVLLLALLVLVLLLRRKLQKWELWSGDSRGAWT
jgi:hypothetical protein